MFWPREIWGCYAAQLDEFRAPANRAAALHCLNHMVVDALQHVPHCMRYMAALRNPDVFRWGWWGRGGGGAAAAALHARCMAALRTPDVLRCGRWC